MVTWLVNSYRKKRKLQILLRMSGNLPLQPFRWRVFKYLTTSVSSYVCITPPKLKINTQNSNFLKLEIHFPFGPVFFGTRASKKFRGCIWSGVSSALGFVSAASPSSYLAMVFEQQGKQYEKKESYEFVEGKLLKGTAELSRMAFTLVTMAVYKRADFCSNIFAFW